MCRHYFTFDEIKDNRVEIPVELSNGTRAKIPLCEDCDWDQAKAEKHMIRLWTLEQDISNAPKQAKTKAIKVFSKLKIIKREYG